MKKLLAVFTVLSLMLVIGLGVTYADHDTINWNYQIELTELNNSGVSGEARVRFEGNTVTTYINAQGLVPDVPHAQHIHGLDAKNEFGECPPPEADVNNDGNISVGEGAPFYGPVIVPLTPFPTATSDGEITYLERGLDAPAREVQPLIKRVIVVHGGFLADGTYDPSLPVACGTFSD